MPYWAGWHKRRYIVDESEGFMNFINGGGYSDLFHERKQYEWERQRERDKADLGPDLFQAARLARRKERAYSYEL